MSDIFLKNCTMPPRLSELCLDTIVIDFPRYNYAFTTSEDVTLKRLLEFLRIKYSYDLLVRLSVREDSMEGYMEFLINKYLRSLDTAWLRNSSWERVVSKMAEIGSSIEKIIFQDVYFDEFTEETPWQDIVCFLPNLKNFSFKDDCHDLILKNVAKFCPDIEYIDFENSDVTFEAAKSLCRSESGKAFCTKLKKLFIAGSNIRDDGVKYILKNLKSLEIIDYPDLPLVLHSLHKNDLQSLDKVEPYNITSLDLFHCIHYPFFADLLKVCLTVCPHLKSLTCGLSNKDELDIFPSLPNLEYLDLENDGEIIIDSVIKSNGSNLTFLTIANCSVSVSVLAESCPRVKELVMKNVKVLYEEDYKPVFNSLTSCTFESTNLTKGAKPVNLFIASAPKLESISFKKCNVLHSDLKAYILKCCESYPVKKISFSFSVIEKEYLKDLLLNCNTLNYLDIDGCFDTDDEEELVKFAEILSNKPEIHTGDHLDISDYEEYLNGNYELEDYELDYDYDFDYDYEGYDDDNDFEEEDDSDVSNDF